MEGLRVCCRGSDIELRDDSRCSPKMRATVGVVLEDDNEDDGADEDDDAPCLPIVLARL